MRLIYLIMALFLPLASALAQNSSAQQTSGAPLNQVNSKGQRQGIWWIRQPERMGEDAFVEFGSYNGGRKYGLWYKMDGQGELTAIEQYRNDVLDGEVKYFEQGHLVAIGHYYGLNPARPFDTIIVVDPGTGLQSLRSIATGRGSLRHGTWRFYDPETGRLLREEEYQVDELLSRKEFRLTSTDSAYYQQRIQALPHNRKVNYTPPPGKQFHYSNY